MYYKTKQVIDHKRTGEHWRAIRISRGITQRQLADAIGYRPSYISDLELGRRSWSNAAEHRFKSYFNARKAG